MSQAPSTRPGPIHASHPHLRIQPPPIHSRPHAHGMCCCPPALYILLTHADQPPTLYMCHSSFLPSPFARSCPPPWTAHPAPLHAPFNAPRPHPYMYPRVCAATPSHGVKVLDSGMCSFIFFPHLSVGPIRSQLHTAHGLPFPNRHAQPRICGAMAGTHGGIRQRRHRASGAKDSLMWGRAGVDVKSDVQPMLVAPCHPS